MLARVCLLEDHERGCTDLNHGHKDQIVVNIHKELFEAAESAYEERVIDSNGALTNVKEAKRDFREWP